MGFFISNRFIFISMELKKLLIQILEGTCERLPDESDEDFLTRCGNNGFDQMDRLRMAQNNMVWNRNVMKETNNTNPSSAMRPEPHPTRHEKEHPSDEDSAFPHVKAVKDWQKKNRNEIIRLKELVKEYDNKYHFANSSHLFPMGAKEAAVFGIVVSHKDGITPEEGKNIVKAFEKADPDADLIYYPSTKKVVGKVGVHKFFMPGKVSVASVKMSPDINKARIKHELDRIKKGLDITKKSVPK